MSKKYTTSLPALLFFTFLLGIPATGCVAHPHHRTVVSYEIRKAPPAPKREVKVVKPGRGYVWVGGHYVWKPARNNYVWVAGKWVKPPRAGVVWVAPRYEKRRGGWVFVAGYWR